MTYQELIRDHAASMIEKLVTDVVTKDPLEIRFDFADNDQWAIITMHVYEEDKEISIRLHPENNYDLYFGYYDDDDEFFEIIKPLSEEEKDMLPVKLKKLMAKVLSDEQGLRLPGNFLSR